MVRHMVRSWRDGFQLGEGIATQTASDITLSRLVGELILPLLIIS